MKPLINLRVQGVEKLQGRLEDLEKKLQQRVLRAALRKGAAVYRREIRKNIASLNVSAEAKQKLRRNLRVRVERTRWGNLLGRVRMVHPSKPFWLWLEKGTADRYRVVESEFDLITIRRRAFKDSRSKTGKWRKATEYKAIVRRAKRTAYTGKIKAQPFVRPAVEAARDEAIRALDAELRKQVDRAWQRSK